MKKEVPVAPFGPRGTSFLIRLVTLMLLICVYSRISRDKPCGGIGPGFADRKRLDKALYI